jgi:hypothetical protein
MAIDGVQSSRRRRRKRDGQIARGKCRVIHYRHADKMILTPAMMMRIAFVAIGRHLIGIAGAMAEQRSFDGIEATDRLGGVRQRSGAD